MTSVSSTTTTPPTIKTGNAQDVGNLTAGNINLSLADEVTTKVQPYIDRATSIQTEINTNNTQIAAYQNMQSLLQTLQSTAANLTSESIQGTNVFSGRVANLSGGGGTVPASSILSASVAAGTATGTHTIAVNQLASAESDTSATLNLTSTQSISTISGKVWPGDGTVTIAASGSTGAVPVALNSAMSLSDVAAAINNTTKTNGVTASVVSVSSTQQALVLTATKTDTPLSFIDTAAPGILQYLGIIGSTLTGETSPTAQAGSFTINSGGENATVTVNAGDSLATIAANINTAASGTAINAQVVNNQLQINGNGVNPINFTGITGSALSSLGFASSGAASQGTPPQAAVLTVDGIGGITRTSNTINDVISGVTLNLTQQSPQVTPATTPATYQPITLQIAPDAASAGSAIATFVAAYNGWESFVTQNEATSSGGGAAAGAVLFGNPALRDASLAVDDAITATVNGTALGVLGISLNGANQLLLNSTTLTQQLAGNFSSVASLFQSQITTDSSDLTPSPTDYGSFSGTFTLGVTASGGNVTGLTLNGQNASNDFTFSGNTISGVTGSAYAGIYFTYSGGNGTNAVTVTATQGIANQLYTATNNFSNSLTGSVQNLINTDQTENQSYTSNYNTLINEANSYTNFLVQQYSDLTTRIQNSGQTLNTLTALINASNNSNG